MSVHALRKLGDSMPTAADWKNLPVGTAVKFYKNGRGRPPVETAIRATPFHSSGGTLMVPLKGLPGAVRADLLEVSGAVPQPMPHPATHGGWAGMPYSGVVWPHDVSSEDLSAWYVRHLARCLAYESYAALCQRCLDELEKGE